MNDAELKRARIAKVAKYGVAFAAVAVLEPFLMAALQGTVALVATAAVGLVAVNLAPYLEMKLRNTKLKLIKREAAKNPIETLQNQWIDMNKALEERAQAVKVFNTETNNYKDTVEEFSTKYPAKAPTYQKQLSKMQFVLNKQLQGLQRGKQKLDEFQDKITETSAEWDMAQAALRASSAMNKFEQPDPIEFMKQQTALNAVRSAMNEVIADLDNSIAMDYNTIDVEAVEVKNQKAITNNPGQVIDELLAQTQPQELKVPVQR